MIERIKKVIAYTGLSDRAFAIKCGINQPTLFNQLKGINAINLNTIKAIKKTFTEISGDWLLSGEGEMLKESPMKEIERTSKMLDTINTLQEVINAKNETIAMLEERIKQLENKNKVQWDF